MIAKKTTSLLLGLVLLAPALSWSENKDAQAMVDLLSSFSFDQLGHPQIQSDSIRPVLASANRPHKLLVLPVRFTDGAYDRFAGDSDQDQKNRDYFQKLLFAGGVDNPVPATLSHYYHHQSRGLYNITGDIFPVVEVPQPLHYYGRPVQVSDGSWRNDERASELVADSLRAAFKSQPDFPWADYDRWDPTDFDGDGNRDEADGYLDHFVLVVAGKGQAACQGLYKLGEKLNVNASSEAFFDLSQAEQDCADRIWPHRFTLSQNLDQGPVIDGKMNTRGGLEIGNGMWVLDYNMQTEYTEVSTFIHEFGHSLGLPDIYARQTNNSTASWEAMSATASPKPQELSTWSRMVLGWMRPCVVQPPGLGGKKTGSLYLKTMNDWSGKAGYQAAKDVCDAAMVVLPPKFRDIKMGPLGENNGRQVAYTGQGNSMNRSLSRRFDLHSVPADTAVLMSLDAWFVIEAEWDYLYVEAAAEGEAFRRLMPVDKSSIADKNSVMPSGKGHDGAGTTPGFTGRSGDMDGDGKVELAADCDPGKQRALAEDRIGQQAEDPCEAAQWISAQFDLSEYRGRDVTLRFTYFTDGAAVEDGALLDNIAIPAIAFRDDFEGAGLENWDNRGFTLSTGSHHLAVPHFYLLEYRDPYERFAAVKNYDNSLSEPGFTFFPDGEGGMRAVNINYRPGVLMWYYNGEYLWSQNDPAATGPGRGFLLLVDSTPQEFRLPALPAKYFRETDGWSHWDLDASAQELLRNAFVDTMCFQRRPAYYSTDVALADRQGCASEVDKGVPPMEALSWNGRQLMYGYAIVNELLPGEQRRARKSGSTLFDLRIRDGKTQYRLYDRMLRNRHSADAPFALQVFANGVEFYRGENGQMVRQSADSFAPVSEFSDARPNLYQNPKLPFGGADIPEEGFNYRLSAVGKKDPAASKIELKYDWRHISDK